MRYRIYLIDDRRHMYRAGEFYGVSDTEAGLRLNEFGCPSLAAELWEGGRLVACLRRPGCRDCPHDPVRSAL